jgi:hypothetical protein
MSANGEIHIRSYRVVFDLERRLHRIDRWRLPLPYGLPIRSLAYAAITLIAVLITTRLPGLGSVVAVVPAPARLVLVPVAVALVLTRINVDGRTAHRTAAAMIGFVLRPKRIAACRRAPAVGSANRLGSICMAPDGRSPRLRRGIVRGAAVARLRYPVALDERRRSLRVEQTDERPLEPGVRIEFGATRRLVTR